MAFFTLTLTLTLTRVQTITSTIITLQFNHPTMMVKINGIEY